MEPGAPRFHNVKDAGLPGLRDLDVRISPNSKLAPLKSDSTSPSSSFTFGHGGKIEAPPLGELVTPRSRANTSRLPRSPAETAGMELSPTSLPRSLTAAHTESVLPLKPLGHSPLSRGRKTLMPLRSTSYDMHDSSAAPVGIPVGSDLEQSIELSPSHTTASPAGPRVDATSSGGVYSPSAPPALIEQTTSSPAHYSATVASQQEVNPVETTNGEPAVPESVADRLPIEPVGASNAVSLQVKPSAAGESSPELLGDHVQPAASTHQPGQSLQSATEANTRRDAEGDDNGEVDHGDEAAVGSDGNSTAYVKGVSEQPSESAVQQTLADVPSIEDADSPAPSAEHAGDQPLRPAEPEELTEPTPARAAELPPPNTPLRGAAATARTSTSHASIARTPSSASMPGTRGLGPLVMHGDTSSPRAATSSTTSQQSTSPRPSASAASTPKSLPGGHASPPPRGLTSGSSVASGLSYSTASTQSLKGRFASSASLTTSATHSSAVRRGQATPQQPLAAQQYEMRYNRAAMELRQALLRLDTDMASSRSIVRNIFRQLNVHEQGELTVQELKNFVLSPELALFEANDPRALKYATLLMEQIDINGDGSVSLTELETFLFPPHMGAAGAEGQAGGGDVREIGVVIDFTRTAVRYHVSSAAAMGSDEAILAEFAKLAKTTLKRGMLDTQLVKKAFLNIKIPEFGRCLTKPEADALVASIDCNDDGVVSANEFKHWLFPANKQGDQENTAQYLRKILNDYYEGDVWAMYRAFCNGSEAMYKNDFVIVLKALDSSVSRHEALAMANKIAGADKAITMANLQTAMGISGRAMQSGPTETASVAFSDAAEVDTASNLFTSPRTKRRQRRQQKSGGGDDEGQSPREDDRSPISAETAGVEVDREDRVHQTPQRTRSRGGGGVSHFDAPGEGSASPAPAGAGPGG
jgi:Ca2+-binding EF-hand superfamily protein